MIKDLYASIPSNNKWLLIYGSLSFCVCVFIFPIGLYFYLHAQLDQRADEADSVLTQKMTNIFAELQYVTSEATASCEDADLKSLRRAAFYSSTFKEVGLFNADFRVYCTSLGAKDFSIFKSITQRIEQSSDRKTVSLAPSNTLGEETFFAFYQGENGIGANGLAAPNDLIEDVFWLLSPDYPYELQIGSQKLSSYGQVWDMAVLAKRQSHIENLSMTLTVFLPNKVYWESLRSLLPWAVAAWIVLYAVLYFGHFSLIHYRYSVQHDIKKAILNDAMEVYFQPIVSLHPGSFHEMEALIRWSSPRHGQVSPLYIVEIANRLGLIDTLTWMVIRKVGAFYREYPKQLNNIKTAVNVDRHSLVKESFAPQLAGILEEYPELKGRLGLEVTETSALTTAELPLMVSRFEQIKVLGICLSVDDFGTGYSGLDFLRRFPYDTLKLDQVFIANLRDDQFTRQVLASVTKLAKELNMRLVAEGVERKDQLDAVTELGVDRVQGYYFCRPLPQKKVIQWFEDNPPK
ncbi:EAL domain-containing protein [Marinomonas transparens]|uniref:cyclic-guanylate-specific phosphodiesterase n=1 Tax=Marinomonas transparens TaxID=2795388 RepID=A0A934MZX7_9GAMM|nr:EAL domain-containing protein [Marinomonas transparens]MBJ7538015.1 EAL domain-containing protein [Marinomonas transparens]